MIKKVINYLLDNGLAEIPKRGRTELKSIIIDDKKFRYNKDKPISNVLTKKLLTIKKTNEYRSYAMKKATDVVSRERVRQLITKHAIRNKFRVRDIQSAFRRYANSIVLENKHFQGERGLEMIAHQKPRLLEFLRKNRSMKLNIRTEALFEKPKYDDGGNEIGTFYAQKPLHTEAFTHRSLYTQKLLHAEAFTHRSFYRQMLLHTEAATHGSFYTQNLLHTNALTQRSFLHTEAFTQRTFYTQTH